MSEINEVASEINEVSIENNDDVTTVEIKKKENLEKESESISDSKTKLVTGECPHYTRRCSFVSPCCGKVYVCRVCHDDVEDHQLVRTDVQQINCLQCGTTQPVGKNCTLCGIMFGKYACLKCRLYDDTDRQQFHCDGCGLCRVGGREKFFHCEKCQLCLGIGIKDTHKCIENGSKRNCAVCLEDLHTSRTPIHIPKCGHGLHVVCFEGMFEHGNSSCPTCAVSMSDMSQYWKRLDDEVTRYIMPLVYRNYKVNILCRDCHEKSNVLYHVIGFKCRPCGSYNTTRIGGDPPPPEDPVHPVVTSPEGENTDNTQEMEGEGLVIIGGEGEDEISDAPLNGLEESWETISGSEGPETDQS